MLRKITLLLLILFSVGVMLPFDGSTAHGIHQGSAGMSQRYYRRHSRAWWRRYRARQRMRREALAHRRSPLGIAVSTTNTGETGVAVLPKAPVGWVAPTISNTGEVKFHTETTANVPSQATLAVVARSRPNPAYLTQREQRTMLAGVAFSDLRRIVIDKMINAGGWVINDYERQVNGARVFVVIAQTPSDGRSPEKSWNFYFAEVDGKIYSLTLNTPVQFSGGLAAEGEKFISSLAIKAMPNAQPANR
jgi:hypothetical protein